MRTNKCVMVDDDDTDTRSPHFACCMDEEFTEQLNCTYYLRVPERGQSEYSSSCQYCYKGKCMCGCAIKEAVLLEKIAQV